MILSPSPPTECARGELAPTLSYDARTWQWEPAEPWQHDRDGTLFIFITKPRARGPKTTIHEYAVQVEWERAVDFGLASFLLENVRSPDLDGPIRCVVGGMWATCSCEHGQIAARRACAAECKHVAACRDLLQQGVI